MSDILVCKISHVHLVSEYSEFSIGVKSVTLTNNLVVLIQNEKMWPQCRLWFLIT